MKMRKLLALAMTAAMTFTFAGCGGSTGSKEDAAPQEAAEETAAEETEAESADTDADSDASYKVGVVQLVQHEALDAATEGFQKALEDELGDQVELDVQVASGEKDQCSTIVNTFVSNDYDLIMANATPALQAAQAATADIPIVGTSVTDYATALDISDWNGTTGMNITGYSDLAPLDEQAQLLNDWTPADKYPNLGILYCSNEANSKYQADVISKDFEKMGYTVKTYTFADSNDLASVATTACQDSDVIYIPTDNTAADNTENIRNVAEPQKVPILVGEESMCKGCGVATLSISYYDMGYEAGKMAADILKNGTDPSGVEIGTVGADDLTKKYNEEIVEAIGIETPDLEGYEKLDLSE